MFKLLARFAFTWSKDLGRYLDLALACAFLVVGYAHQSAFILMLSALSFASFIVDLNGMIQRFMLRRMISRARRF